MSEPPPKPAHRPVRKPKDIRPEETDEFDFDVTHSPIEQPQASQQQLSRGAEAESVGSLAQEPSDPSHAESSSAEPEAPPRPPQRPTSRPSRPIHIQPAPADPPHVRQESDLKAELESLDKPGAQKDESTVERFKQVESKLEEEGPGGPTAAQLGFPALGPQKVLQNAAPPPKPLTRPARRYKSPNDEPGSHSADAGVDKDADVAAKDKKADKSAHELESCSPSEKDVVAEKGSISDKQPVVETHAESQSGSDYVEDSDVNHIVSKEEPFAKRDQALDEPVENSSIAESQLTAKDDLSKGQLNSEGDLGAHEKLSPKVEDDNTTVKDVRDAIHIRDTADSSLGTKSPSKTEPSESRPQGSSVGSPGHLDTYDGPSIGADASNEATEKSSREKPQAEEVLTDLRSSKFIDPAAEAPEESSGPSSETLTVHPSLSKENIHSVDVSEFTSIPPSDRKTEVSSFAEPATEAPDNSSASGKKHVEFDDLAAHIRSNGKNDSTNMESTNDVPKENEASLETSQEETDLSDKVVEPKASQMLESSLTSKDLTSEKDQTEDESEVRSSGLASKSVTDAIKEPIEKYGNKETDEDHSDKLESSHNFSREHASEKDKGKVESSDPVISKRESDPSDKTQAIESPTGTVDSSERRTSEPVDPKDVSGKPPRPQHRPELKPKPVPKPKPKNALTSRFEAALRESEASKPKPVPKPKPREGSGNRVSAIQASMFANLNEALSRGPPPGGRPRFGSNDSQEHSDQHSEENSSRIDQKVDINESAEAQIQAMPKNPRARTTGPRRAKRLPESAKPKFSIVVGNEPLWQILADEQEPDYKATRRDSTEKKATTELNDLAQSKKSTDLTERETASDTTHESGVVDEEQEPSHIVDSVEHGQKTKEPGSVAQLDKTGNSRDDLEKNLDDGLYSEPTVETRWIPDSVTQAVPSQKPNADTSTATSGNVAPDDGATRGASSSRTSMDSNRSDQHVPNLGFNTEIDLRSALERHLSHDSSGTTTDSQPNSSNYSVKVEDLPPLGSLVDRVPSPPAVDETSSRASMQSLMTPQRPKAQTSVSSLGVKTLSQYLDKSPQAGAAPSGWDRMPASSKLDLGEAEGLLKDVSEMKEQHSQSNAKSNEVVDSVNGPEEASDERK